MICTRWLANPNWGRSHFPHDRWSSYGYLIHYQNEDFKMLSKWSCRSSPNMLTMEPNIMVIIFGTYSPISFWHMSLCLYPFIVATPNPVPLKCKCGFLQVTKIRNLPYYNMRKPWIIQHNGQRAHSQASAKPLSLRRSEWRVWFRGQTTSKPSIRNAPSYGLQNCSGSPEIKLMADVFSRDEKSMFARWRGWLFIRLYESIHVGFQRFL
jgi:hypothetical protein